MKVETALISSRFDEAAALVKLGEQGQGRGSAPVPHASVPTARLERSCQPPLPRDPAHPQAAPQIRVEFQWDRLAPTLHVLSGSEGCRGMEAPPILQQENGLRVLSVL